MGEDRLDKFIKDQVFDHRTPTDIDQMWEGILAKQQKKEEPKRRFFWLWFLGGFLVAGCLFGYGLFIYNGADTQSALNTPTTINSESGTVSQAAHQAMEAEASATTPAIKSINEKQSATASLTDETVKKDIVNNNNNNNNNNTSSDTSIKNESNFQTTKNVNKTNNAQNSANPVNENAEKLDEIFDAVQSSVISAPSNQLPDNGSTAKVMDTTTAIPNTTTDSKRSNLTSLTMRTLLSTIEWTLPLFDVKEEDLPPTIPVPVPGLIKSKKESSPFSIGASFGYGFADKQLKARSEDGGFGYKQLREDTESAQQILGAGLDLKYQHKSGLYAKVGLQFEQITDRFDYSNISTTMFFNDTAVHTIKYDASGEALAIRGTESTRIRTQRREIYNRYRSFDVPLLIGYQPQNKRRLNWFVEGGALVNLSFATSGEMLDIDGETIIDLSTSDVFEQNLGLSLMGGVGLTYRLTKKLSIWASPRVRYGLKNMMTEPNLLEQRYLRGTMEVGVRVGF